MPDDLPEHRVAITVFATVQAVDDRDGSFIATYAIRKALEDAADEVGNLTFRSAKGERAVHLQDVMDTGMAAGNGYLWLQPTAKSYKETRGIK